MNQVQHLWNMSYRLESFMFNKSKSEKRKIRKEYWTTPEDKRNELLIFKNLDKIVSSKEPIDVLRAICDLTLIDGPKNLNETIAKSIRKEIQDNYDSSLLEERVLPREEKTHVGIVKVSLMLLGRVGNESDIPLLLDYAKRDLKMSKLYLPDMKYANIADSSYAKGNLLFNFHTMKALNFILKSKPSECEIYSSDLIKTCLECYEHNAKCESKERIELKLNFNQFDCLKPLTARLDRNELDAAYECEKSHATGYVFLDHFVGNSMKFHERWNPDWYAQKKEYATQFRAKLK